MIYLAVFFVDLEIRGAVSEFSVELEVREDVEVEVREGVEVEVEVGVGLGGTDESMAGISSKFGVDPIPASR